LSLSALSESSDGNLITNSGVDDQVLLKLEARFCPWPNLGSHRQKPVDSVRRTAYQAAFTVVRKMTPHLP